MKPNDKAYQAARAAILKAVAERNCIIVGVPFNENNTDEFDTGEAIEHAKVALDAAYAAQFPPSEDYAGLVKELRERAGSYDIHDWHREIELNAADAIEAVLAERDTYKNWLDNYEKQFAAKVEELITVRLERDALLARLAPVADETLVEIVAKEFIEATIDMPPRTTYTISERSLGGARAAIAAIRPHIEADERERCAKIAEGCIGNDALYCTTDAGREGFVTACRAIAAAIRSEK